jgi:hypothetical protein
LCFHFNFNLIFSFLSFPFLRFLLFPFAQFNILLKTNTKTRILGFCFKPPHKTLSDVKQYIQSFWDQLQKQKAAGVDIDRIPLLGYKEGSSPNTNVPESSSDNDEDDDDEMEDPSVTKKLKFTFSPQLASSQDPTGASLHLPTLEQQLPQIQQQQVEIQ